MTTTSISGSEFGRAGNFFSMDDLMQRYYWRMLTDGFDRLCREKGSSAWIELELAEVYFKVDDKTEIDFHEILKEAKEYACHETMKWFSSKEEN